ncbi:MAG TPA: hypothetical protein VFW05_00430 [Verrucomicrobiae bacterium]|nr:hypothetical protein [Verrucomicrobiae bacterium]
MSTSKAAAGSSGANRSGGWLGRKAQRRTPSFGANAIGCVCHCRQELALSTETQFRKIGIVELPTNDWSILKQIGSAIDDAIRSLGPDNNYIEIQLPEI